MNYIDIALKIIFAILTCIAAGFSIKFILKKKNQQRMSGNVTTNCGGLAIGNNNGSIIYVENIGNEQKNSLSKNAKSLLQSIPEATTSVYFSKHDSKFHASSNTRGDVEMQYHFSSERDLIETLDELADCGYLEKDVPSQKIKTYSLTEKCRNFLRSR